MATTTARILLDEYLNTVYRPDCDYVDGEVLERNLGEWEHGKLQALIAGYFVARRREWNLHVSTEQRMLVKTDRVRIPDVCVVVGREPSERVLTSPPLLCIEVLSTCDTRIGMRTRIADFLDFGVLHVWLIDPQSRRAWIYSGTSETEVQDGILRAGSLSVPMTELFD